MRVYLGIKYHTDHANRETIDRLCAHLVALGHHPYCVARDLERWGAITLSPRALMAETFRRINESDLVLIDFSEKGVGLGVEAGYARCRGIPVVVVARTGSDISTTIQGTADRIVFYDTISEIGAQHLSYEPNPIP